MSRPLKPHSIPFTAETEHLKTDPLFLIGNGNSREHFDLERLRKIGTIIGCNALYRDFTPDILIAIDAKMIKELHTAKFGKENNNCTIITPANRSHPCIGALKWRTERFNTSGCFAMKMVAELMKPTKCYMLGMDSYPGNMYDGTANYAPNTLQNFKGVSSYYQQVLDGPGTTVFINVNLKDAWPKAAGKTGKYEFMTYEEFEKTIMCTT